MKFFKKDSPEIVFECENWATRTYSPIRPAKEFFPEKFNDLPTIIEEGEYQKTNIYSIKICPGLRDYMGNGFVVPAWCDMHIKITDKVPEIIYSDFDIKKMYHLLFLPNLKNLRLAFLQYPVNRPHKYLPNFYLRYLLLEYLFFSYF